MEGIARSYVLPQVMSVFPPSKHHVVVLSIDGDLPLVATLPLGVESLWTRSTCDVTRRSLGESEG